MDQIKSNIESWYIKNWRWFVLSILFLATFLNYFDRQTLGIAIEPIAKEFNFDNIQRGNLLSAFIFSYAFTHLFVGAIIDRIKNIRIFFPIMLMGWSFTIMLVGIARDYTTILWLRYLLGVWEAVNFPISIMIIARIFPARERSLATGIFASGAFLATLAAPPVVIYLSNVFNWRWSFIVAGLLGFLWLVPWLIIFRNPGKRSLTWYNYQIKPIISLSKSINEIVSGYGSIIKSPSFWAVALIGLGIIPSLYFATQWFPSFFTQQLNHPYDHNLSVKLSVIYFMQDIGLWLGGGIVLYLSKKGMSILNSRKSVMTGAFMIMIIPMFFMVFSQFVQFTIVFLSLYVMGIGMFLANQHAFKQDVDKTQVATVAALVGFIETGFTAFVIKEIGVLTNITGDFTLVFGLLIGLAFFSMFIVYFMLRPKWFQIE